MVMAGQDGLVRVWISLNGKSTSVSLDDLLFGALIERLGTNDAAVRWVRTAASRVEHLRDVGSPLVSVHKAGTSRLVQRLALNFLLSPAAEHSETS